MIIIMSFRFNYVYSYKLKFGLYIIHYICHQTQQSIEHCGVVVRTCAS